MNLRTKFHLASAFLILTVVIGVMSSLIVLEKKKLLSDMAREQREDLDKLARVCKDALAVSPDETGLINYLRTLVDLSAPKVVYAGVIYDRPAMSDPWIFSALNGLVYLDGKDPEVALIRDTRKLLEQDIDFQGKRIHELSKPVDGIGYVRLGYSRDVMNRIFRRAVFEMAYRFLIIGVVAILLGLILASFFSRALSRPIKDLMGAAEAISQGKKGVKIPVRTRDELGRLTTTFNRMSEELAKLDQMKDDFMSHVTHELRSPLTSIIATVELMAELPATQADPKMKRSVDRLMYGSERLNRLVDNILDLMRLEAGKMSFDIQPIDIRTIMAEMADFFEPRAAEKTLTIQTALPQEFPLVMADAERVRQVLSNLIYNAVKFTNRGGITLSVAIAKSMPGFAQIRVADTGVGIPPDKISRLFHKFETLKDTRDRVEKPVPGSGLGLNIVLNSVEAQGGKIWVESEVDKGSVFCFALPLASAPVRALTGSVVSEPPSTLETAVPVRLGRKRAIL